MSNSDFDLSLGAPAPAPEEEFYLFRPATTGFLRPKKVKPFPDYQSAFDAGLALNILDGTPDKIFIILSSKAINCHTNITDKLPFSNSFFRFSRLSDQAEKFKAQASEPGPSFSQFSPERANLLAGLSINQNHPALFQGPEIDPNEPKEILFSKAGLNPNNAPLLQSLIQYKLGISQIPPQDFPESHRLFALCANEKIFSDLKEANRWLSQKIMKREI